MAQYDLIIPQNTAATGVEWIERYINIQKGGLLSAKADGVPVVLDKGTNGHMLVADSTTESGLKWQPIPVGHTQNTDTGTTSKTFQLDTENGGVIIESEDSDMLVIKYGGEAPGHSVYADVKVENITIYGNAYCFTAPTHKNHLTNKAYVDGLVGALDGALVYKGTLGSGGTVTALPTTHGIGWTYRVISAGTYAGAVCEIGDLITSIVARTGSGNQNTDWTVAQTNIDGAVVGPSGSISNELVAVFDSNNRKLKGGPQASQLITQAFFSEHSMIYGNGLGSATTLTVGASTLVGRKATGGVAALGESDVRTLLGYAKWVDAPLTKTSTGTKGDIAQDESYFYVCVSTNKWGRSPLAINWINPENPES